MTFHNRLRSQKIKEKGDCDHRSGRCSSFSGQCSWHGLFHFEHIKKKNQTKTNQRCLVTVWGLHLASCIFSGQRGSERSCLGMQGEKHCGLSLILHQLGVCSVLRLFVLCTWMRPIAFAVLKSRVSTGGQTPKCVAFLKKINHPPPIILKSPTKINLFPPCKIQCAVIWNRQDHSVSGSPVGTKAHI